MSVFLRKSNGSVRIPFQKAIDQGKIAFQKNVAPITRKISNTIHDVNNFALPALGIASMAQPEFAPIFGGIGLGLKVLDGVAGASSKLAKATFVDGNNQSTKRPQLEK